MPTLITLAILVGLTIAYLGVRSARQHLLPPPPAPLQLGTEVGGLQLQRPDGWRSAAMDNVAGASGRWAAGPRGAREHALFVTRYPLRAVPQGERQYAQVRREAERALRATGAQRRRLQVKPVDWQDSRGWTVRFSDGRLQVDSMLLVHVAQRRAALYQLSCQSPAGRPGAQLRRACRHALDGLRFPTDTP